MLRRQRLRRQRKRSGDALSDLFFGTAVPGRRKDRTMNTMSRPDLPVVVIGAGPVGLAAAAHLVERGLRPLVLERGTRVGAALHAWGPVTVFSPRPSTPTQPPRPLPPE